MQGEHPGMHEDGDPTGEVKDGGDDAGESQRGRDDGEC